MMMRYLPEFGLDLVLIVTGSTFFALFWALSALHKVMDWPMYRSSVRDYRILPEPLQPAAAAGILMVELGLAVSWLVDRSRELAGLTSAVLLIVYGLAMAYNLAQGRNNIECGCGGDAQTIHWTLVLRNAILAVLAFCCGIAMTLNSRSLNLMDFFSIAAGGLAFYGVYIVCNQIMANNSTSTLTN